MAATHRHGAAAAAIVIALGAWGVGAHAAAAEYPPEIPKDLDPVVPVNPVSPVTPGSSNPLPPSPDSTTVPDVAEDPVDPYYPEVDSNGDGDNSESNEGTDPSAWDPNDPYRLVNALFVTPSKSAKKRAAPNTLANPVSERPSRTGADGIGLLLALGVVAVGAGTGMAVSSARSRRSSAAGQ